ncbi:MAG: hypothetical protein ACO1SV_04540 [Fimbriimonas sp.]
MLSAIALVAAAQAYRAQYPLPNLTAPSGWGVNIHFTDPQPGEIDRLAGAGFRWVRMDFFWHQIETRKGTYDFAAYDRLLAALKPKGIRPVFILDYGNDLYQKGSPRTPEARAAFARFVAAAVRRYRGRGIVWEMWNEPNIHFWSPRPDVDEYIALAQTVQATIRKVAPEEWHVGPATSGFDWTFLRRCFQAGLLKGWDAVTVHPYRSLAPETVGEDWSRLRALIDRYAPKGKAIPMLSGEWGYSDVAPGMGRSRQAHYASRMYLANLTHDVPLTILYDWRDDGDEPKEPEHHFGTVTHREIDPKPSYRAVRFLTRELEGYRYHLRLALPSRDDVLLAFRKGDALKFVAYTTGPRDRVVRLTLGAKTAFRLSGPWGARSLPAGAAAVGTTLTPSPQVFTPLATNPTLRAIGLLEPLPPFATYTDRASAARIALDAARRFRRVGPARNSGLNPSLDPVSSPVRFSATSPDGTVLTQETMVRPLRPVTLTPSLGNPGLSVTLGNPEGNAFSGTVVVRRGGESRRRSFDLRASQASLPVSLPDVPATWAAGGVDVVVEREGKPAVAMRSVSLRPLPRLAAPRQPLAPAYRIELEGDAQKKGVGVGRGISLTDAPGGHTEGLDLQYRFQPGWKYLMLKPIGAARQPLPGRPQTLGMWVRGDGSGDMLRMRFVDATDQTFQPDWGAIDWKGWRYVTFRLDATAAGRWGGAGDGVVHYPIRIDSVVLIDNKGGDRSHGIAIAAPTIVGSSQRNAAPKR